jgi:uncharacterized protein YgfB (UPF0149 family)
MLQHLEAADHGLDARANLLVLLHQRRAVRRKALLPLPQRTIFLAHLAEQCNQLVDLAFEAFEFDFEIVLIGIAHRKNIERRASKGNQKTRLRHNCHMSELHYAELQKTLANSRALTDAPEAHGTLAGALCAAEDYALEDWLVELYADGRTDPDAHAALFAIFEATRAALASDQPLAARTTALGQWCQGFLYGLGSSRIPDPEALPEQIGEIVRDLSAITQVAVDEGESEETNESSYTELVEFVRVGAQLLFDELQPWRVPAATEGVPPASLH